jgi:hypothetical protein
MKPTISLNSLKRKPQTETLSHWLFRSSEPSKPPRRVVANSTRWFFALTVQVTMW